MNPLLTYSAKCQCCIAPSQRGQLVSSPGPEIHAGTHGNLRDPTILRCGVSTPSQRQLPGLRDMGGSAYLLQPRLANDVVTLPGAVGGWKCALCCTPACDQWQLNGTGLRRCASRHGDKRNNVSALKIGMAGDTVPKGVLSLGTGTACFCTKMNFQWALLFFGKCPLKNHSRISDCFVLA